MGRKRAAPLRGGNKGPHRSSGSKLCSDKVHGEGLEKLARERNETLTDVELQAGESQLAVASKILRIDNTDLADEILPKRLDRVNLKCAFALDADEILDAEAI